MNLFPNFSMETWTLLILFLTLLSLYGIWPYGFFKKYGIPGPRPLPFIGTFLENRKGQFEFDMECFKKYGNLWGIYDGRKPVLAIMDPVIIKAILVKECFTLFTNRRSFGLNGPLESALSFAEDEQWKRIRTVLSPAFTSGKLKQMFPLMKHYGDLLMQNATKKVNNKETIVMKDIFSAYSMDAVLGTSFSVNVDSINNPNDPFVINGRKLFDFSFLSPLIILTVLFPCIIPALDKMNFCFFPTSVIQFFTDAIKRFRNTRQKGIQAPPTYDALTQMEYLDMAINETLRLFPAAGRIERVCKRTTEINGLTIPGGVVTMIPAYVLHRNPEFWPEPEEFQPERFSKENRETQEPYTFLPFGAGPRNCIGMRFALLNMKVAITVLVQNFTFQPCKETPIPLEIDSLGILKSKRPIILNLVPRTAQDTEE
ncbi:cytochrome P450 3A29-like isoform X2 [Ascaphus truei]|uniref:cytochrome P450 3A29-like isoform X2 n=1 Tax=Ascaphus truei TaxID=8439 RepID=UPI003F59B7A7